MGIEIEVCSLLNIKEVQFFVGTTCLFIGDKYRNIIKLMVIPRLLIKIYRYLDISETVVGIIDKSDDY